MRSSSLKIAARWVFCASLSIALAIPASRADENDAATNDVDHAQREDLGAGLLEDDAEPDTKKEASSARDVQLDDQLTLELIEPAGEGLAPQQGRLAGDDWLRQVTERMRSAEAALAGGDASGRASAAQQEAVSGLDAMIAKLQKQCEKCGGQCNKPSSPGDKPPQPNNKSGGKPGASNLQLTQADAQPVDRTALGNLVKDLWGRLPERQREELLQPLSEEFLPEYAAEIEDYFRVLAEPTEKAETRP